MDPYCKIQVGGQQFKTKVCHSGGKTPSWSDTFTFHRTTEQTILIYIFDHDTFTSDDYVCEGQFDLSNVCCMGGQNCYRGNLPLHYKGKPSGHLYLEVMFNPDAHAGMNPMAGMGMGMGMGMGGNQMMMNQNMMGMGTNPMMMNQQNMMGMGMGMGTNQMMAGGYGMNPMNNANMMNMGMGMGNMGMGGMGMGGMGMGMGMGGYNKNFGY